ncbi:MAG: hypothetical protein ACK4Y4_01810 [Brevundimonas sp.]
MAEEPLVEADIQAGSEFVKLLDEVGIPVQGAFWLYQADAARWRLVIVTDEARRGAKELYLKAINAGAAIELSKVEFQPPESAIFRALGGMIHIAGLGQVRMQQNTFNGVYVEDALVYRLAA